MLRRTLTAAGSAPSGTSGCTALPSPARLQCRRTSASPCAAGRALLPHRTVRSCRQVELRFLNDAPLQIIQRRSVLKWTYVCVGVPTRPPACARVPAHCASARVRSLYAAGRRGSRSTPSTAACRARYALGYYWGDESKRVFFEHQQGNLEKARPRATAADIRQPRGKRRIGTTSAQDPFRPETCRMLHWCPLHVAPLDAAAQTVDVMHELTEKPIKGLFPDDSTSGASTEFSLCAPLPRQPRANRASRDRRTLSRRRAPHCASSARARRRAAAAADSSCGAGVGSAAQAQGQAGAPDERGADVLRQPDGRVRGRPRQHPLARREAGTPWRSPGSGELCSDGSAATG